MKKYYQAIKQEYLETRSHPREDFMEWIIKRKMSWGMRWILVIVLVLVVQPLIFNPLFLLACFYVGLFLFLFYSLGQLFFLLRAAYRKLIKR